MDKTKSNNVGKLTDDYQKLETIIACNNYIIVMEILRMSEEISKGLTSRSAIKDKINIALCILMQSSMPSKLLVVDLDGAKISNSKKDDSKRHS